MVGQTRLPRLSVLCLAILGVTVIAKGEDMINSLGMRLMPVQPGEYIMGADADRDRWDERPAHRVVISKPFLISETEVTAEQFRQFKPGFVGTPQHLPFAAGVNWHEATAFCEWLSAREGRSYRLPTEAEWEYVCRAGSTGLYPSDAARPPSPGEPNAWGVRNMLSGVREWCHDWYGDYPGAATALTDPVGPAFGIARVVRGGLLDDGRRLSRRKVFDASSCRASMAPAFGPFYNDSPANRPPAAAEKKAEPPLSARSDAPSPGLIGIRYGNKKMTSVKGQMKLDALEQAWIGGDNDWAVRWIGSIEGPADGEITFIGEADNGMRLEVEGRLVLDTWDTGGQARGVVTMVRGRRYPIALSYYKDGGGASLRLQWKWHEAEPHTIPVEALQYTAGDDLATRVEEDDDDDTPQSPGYHGIGFRIVQAPIPQSQPWKVEPFRALSGVRQSHDLAKRGPATHAPYFRRRYLLPTPPENSTPEEIDAAGMHPSFRGHNHSPALTVCPNGDVLMAIYTSYDEYEPGVSLIATRLRVGAEEWDMPDRFITFATANNHAPLLWTDPADGAIWLFWGNPRLPGGFPFQWTISRDNGATWSEVRFPNFVTPIGPHSRQPINTAFRDADGVLCVASDGEGGCSVLWKSADNGLTWSDPGGRTGGRHTTFALLRDGRGILGMGGKNTNIDGFMPQSISRDGGVTWEYSRTRFAAQGSNQRPSLLRLESGRLFFAGDFQDIDGKQPEGIEQRGSYVALSDDDGLTWTVKSLPGALPHEDPNRLGGSATIGYSVARQAPNGVIHLITTMNSPCLHFEMNEAWILSETGSLPGKLDNDPQACPNTSIRDVATYTEDHPDGGTRIEYSGGIADDGRFLLHGAEVWRRPDGSVRREATYQHGRKVGVEKWWHISGALESVWTHGEDGASTWTQYDVEGRLRAQSIWREMECDGPATVRNRDGQVIRSQTFHAMPVVEAPPAEEHECVTGHFMVYDEPGRYAGWPANGGFWLWDDSEMAVAFECGWFEDRPDHMDGHAKDDRPNEDIVARSTDGGRTWTSVQHDLLSGDESPTVFSGGLDYTHPDFAFKSQGGRFYYSTDRARTWAGPFVFRIEGLPLPDASIESHSCYLANGRQDAFHFLGLEPAGAEDLSFCARTSDGGASFHFSGWISPAPSLAPTFERWAVYSAIETRKGHLIAALRRKINRETGRIRRLNWIDVYESRDNGRTWSFLSKVADTDWVNSDHNGNPPSIVKLQDGRLCVTYGFRAHPFVLCARFSEDDGKTWSQPVVLRSGARNWDFGYSRSLQKPNGKVVTVYYFATPDNRDQFIAATHWDPARVGPAETP